MEIQFKKEQLPLIFLLILGIVYGYFALTTNLLGEDEVVYVDLAKSFAKGIYPSWWGRQPVNYSPLLSFIFTPFFFIFGPSLAIAKLIVSIFGIASLFMTYKLCKKMIPDDRWGLFGVFSMFMLLSIPLFSHFILLSYNEIPIAFFSILFLYVFLDLKDKKHALYLGIVISLAFYMKASAIFFPATLVLFALFRRNKTLIKLSILVLIVFAIGITPFILRNLYLYQYPGVEGLNFFFKTPLISAQWVYDAAKTISPVTPGMINPFDIFSMITFSIGVFGIVYSILSRDSNMAMPIFMLCLFIIIFSITNTLGILITEPRYFSIIYPQLAIVGGFFLYKTSKEWKYATYILLIVIIIFSMNTSFSMAYSTSTNQRYPNDYIKALQFIKQNSEPEDLVFTAYGGSVSYYADRRNVWAMDEFPEIMTTKNSTYVWDMLRNKYNVSFIFIWRGIFAEDYIIPGSNIIGVFTSNFYTVVSNDKEHFQMVYSNANEAIWEVL